MYSSKVAAKIKLQQGMEKQQLESPLGTFFIIFPVFVSKMTHASGIRPHNY